MNVGMLWFDNDPKAALELKVQRAAAYYRDKYGEKPTLCFVNPCMVSNGKDHTSDTHKNEGYSSNGIEIRTSVSMLPNHFWMGIATIQT